MKHQHKNHYQDTTKRKYIIPSVLGVVVVVGAAAVLYGTLGRSTANAEKPVYVHHSAPSPFTYKKDGDWGHAIADGQSLALFGKRDAQGMSPCFVSVQYEPGKVDTTAKLKEKESLLHTHASKLTKLDSKSMTMQTNEGAKHYTLDQFHVESSGSSKLMGGTEYGFFATKDGSVEVTGNCEQVSLLPTTIDALAGVSFDSQKVTIEN